MSQRSPSFPFPSLAGQDEEQIPSTAMGSKPQRVSGQKGARVPLPSAAGKGAGKGLELAGLQHRHNPELTEIQKC